MTKWKYRIELNELLYEAADRFDLERVEEPCPDELKKLINAELFKAPPLYRFQGHIRDAGSIAAVNRVLVRVFDEADAHGVWCGFSGPRQTKAVKA